MFLAGALSPPFNRERERWHSRTNHVPGLLETKIKISNSFFRPFLDFFPPDPSPNRCLFLCPSNYVFPYINSCFLRVFKSVFFVFVYTILARKPFIGRSLLACRPSDFLPVLVKASVLSRCPFPRGPMPCPFSYAFYSCLFSLFFDECCGSASR
jgi:hypothetical protein